MPVAFADGSLGDKLYVNLQEPGGKFPRTKTVFSAPNLYVTCGTSHIMTKKHMTEWISNVRTNFCRKFGFPDEEKTSTISFLLQCIFSPSTSDDLLILLDSWTSFRDRTAIDAALPAGKQLDTRQIPAGATGFCQPLDVFFFRPFKGLVRRIQTFGFKNYPSFIAYQRDNILKVFSVSYAIMCAPVFRPLIQCAWHKAGYLDSPPSTRFQTPVQLCFPRSVFSTRCATTNCPMMSFIKCPKCNKTLCFKCFVVDVHNC